MHKPLIILVIIASLMSVSCDKERKTVTPPLPGTIEGVTRTEAGDSLLSGVQVTTVPATSVVVTGAQGQFEIPDVPVGDYDIAGTKPGFEDATVSVSVSAGQTCSANISMTRIAPPVTGSCCQLDGTCLVTTEGDCGWVWTEAGACTPDPCEALDMVLAPADTFMMGSPAEEAGREPHETRHQVTLTRPFLISPHEVTWAEWRMVMGWGDSSLVNRSRPAEEMSWYDAMIYCNRRSALEGLDSVYVFSNRRHDGRHVYLASIPSVNWSGNGYRLPTEAEWEYACRAGSASAFWTGPIQDTECGADESLDRTGWYCGNASGITHEIMSKQPNAWGLYDMHGNVQEWCWDAVNQDYGSGPVVDPHGILGMSAYEVARSDAFIVARGGGANSPAKECRSASRGWFYPESWDRFGLRVVRTADRD